MHARRHHSGPVLLALALLTGCASAPVESDHVEPDALGPDIDQLPAAPGGAAPRAARSPRRTTPIARVAVLPVVVQRGLAVSGAGVDPSTAHARIIEALRAHPRIEVVEDHAAPRHVARYTARAGCDPFFEADARHLEVDGPVLSPRLIAAPGGRAVVVLIAGECAPDTRRSTTVLVPVLSGPLPEYTLQRLAAELADALASTLR